MAVITVDVNILFSPLVTTMLSKGDILRLYVTYVEKSLCDAHCQLWAQTDKRANDRLETLVTERGVGIAGAGFVDTKSISQSDIVLAQYDTADFLYRAQVSHHCTASTTSNFQSFSIRRILLDGHVATFFFTNSTSFCRPQGYLLVLGTLTLN